jgi:hypothetical protein
MGVSPSRRRRAFFIAFDKADSDKDDLLSYLEIEAYWRSSSR